MFNFNLWPRTSNATKFTLNTQWMATADMCNCVIMCIMKKRISLNKYMYVSKKHTYVCIKETGRDKKITANVYFRLLLVKWKPITQETKLLVKNEICAGIWGEKISWLLATIEQKAYCYCAEPDAVTVKVLNHRKGWKKF